MGQAVPAASVGSHIWDLHFLLDAGVVHSGDELPESPTVQEVSEQDIGTGSSGEACFVKRDGRQYRQQVPGREALTSDSSSDGTTLDMQNS